MTNEEIRNIPNQKLNEMVTRIVKGAITGQDNALKSWLFSGDTGLSSRFMACVLSEWDIPLPNCDYPHDPGDLGRCIRLIECVPEFKDCIHKMNAHGSKWQQVVLYWEQWSELYKTDQNKLFSQMKLAFSRPVAGGL